MKINNTINNQYTQKTSFKASLLDIMNNKYPKIAAQPVSSTNTMLPGAYAPVSTPVATNYNKTGNLFTLMMGRMTASASTAAAPVQTTAVDNNLKTPKLEGYKNNLRSMFQNNQAVIYAMVPRTFNAKDTDGNGLIEGNEESGTFINMIERLDELKSYGVNTLHWLPINPPGVFSAKGDSGSVYAPADYLSIDPLLDDPKNQKNVYEEAKEAINECHKRGIRVMVDLPSCMSSDLYAERFNDLSAVDADGKPKTPEGWEDIKMFKVWEDADKKILNPALVDYHKKFVDMCIDLGIDGIRADVSRAKSPEFWDIIIAYARSKDPEFAMLAETYTYEDASPMKNMPADRPEEALKAGFDSYYGQYHIFPIWKASDFHKFVTENLEMTHKSGFDKGKSIIGSFATHDDKSAMSNGGAEYCMLTNIAQATLPMLNPYIVSGFESGDRYIYDYANKMLDVSFNDLMKKPRYNKVINAIMAEQNSPKFIELEKKLEVNKDEVIPYTKIEALMKSPKANMKLKDLQKDEEFGEVIDFLSTFKLTKDSIIHYAHNEQIDIFNRSRKPGGHNPEIGKHFGKLMNEFRKQYYDVVGAKGSSYMPLKVKGDDRDDVIAYARHNHGKTLVVVMNKNVHSGHRVKVIVPGLKASQILTDLSPEYGQKSVWKAENGAIDMELGMARGHIFEIDDPNIEQLVLESGGKVYKQNM